MINVIEDYENIQRAATEPGTSRSARVPSHEERRARATVASSARQARRRQRDYERVTRARLGVVQREWWDNFDKLARGYNGYTAVL
jgi:hypothetical protein